MKPTVVLHSGQSIPIQKVMLFDEVAVAEIFRLRTEAAKVLGPSGMAVGVFGTPSLALAAEAAALGVLSGLVAAAAQKSALDRLEAARKKAEELRGNGIWIDVEGISNLEFPAPETWYGIQGMRRMNVDISGMSKEQKKNF